jgi:hypothetical protein
MTDLVPVTKPIVGTEAEIRRVLDRAFTEGRLLTPVEQIKSRQLANHTDKWMVTATILEPAPERTWRDRLAELDRRHPLGGPMLKALAFGLAVVAFLLALVLGLLALIWHFLPVNAIAGGGGMLLLLAALAAFAFGRGTGGRHTGHNGKGWHYTDCK